MVDMPKDFYCPITQDLMTIPVILIEDGRSYEKYALQSWLDHHNTSPMTNNVLKNRKFIINYNLKNAIEDFKAKRLKVNYFQELSSLFTIKSCRIPKFYQDHPKLKIKICLLGDSSVGKTTIAKKLQFDDRIQTVPTLGPDFTIFYVDHLYENQYTIIIQLQDIPGMERYGCVYDSHFRTCHGAILVSDITNITSLKRLKTYWYKALNQKAMNEVECVLVCNKIDLFQHKNNEMFFEQAEQLASDNHLSLFYTSALTGKKY